jgi:hypothetical protein
MQVHIFGRCDDKICVISGIEAILKAKEPFGHEAKINASHNKT